MSSSVTLYDDAGNPVVMSGEEIKQLLLGGIGVGQTWQDVSAERVANTDYVNDTGKPIQVSLQTNGNSTTGGHTFYVDGLSQYHVGYSAFSLVFSIVIPAGSTYSCNAGGTWLELR